MKKQYVKFFSFILILILPTTALAQQTTFYNLNINMLRSMRGVLDNHLSAITTPEECKMTLKALQIDYINNIKNMVTSGGVNKLYLTDSQISEIRNIQNNLFQHITSVGYCFVFGAFFAISGVIYILGWYLEYMMPAESIMLKVLSFVFFSFGVLSVIDCLST